MLGSIPSYSYISKIVRTLRMEPSELFKPDEIYCEINSCHKTLFENNIIDKLDDKEK
jgi:hypothetical protein